MKTATIHEAKSNLSKYIAAVKEGEKVYIGSFGKPEVELILVKKSPHKRKLGTGSFKFNPSSDAFCEKVDAEIADSMYSG